MKARAIAVCGLNGAGKSTVGQALAAALCIPLIDSEDLYFPEKSGPYPYACPCTKGQAKEIFRNKLRTCTEFVFAAVRGTLADGLSCSFRCAVWMDAPKALRMQRIRERSFKRFGSRMMPGGDLYLQEKAFFDFADKRDEQDVRMWIHSLTCPVLKMDGTVPVSENIRLLRQWINTGYRAPTSL